MLPAEDNGPAAAAFTRQALHFDSDEESNPILKEWRAQIYRHVARYLKSRDKILELNSGTGIDALHFASRGHEVVATDIAPGMIGRLNEKIAAAGITLVSSHHVSFDQLDTIPDKGFDYVFSNFGGLNCIHDLRQVTRHLNAKLHAGAHVTWVIMPPLCPWEWLRLINGGWREATRRFQSNGTLANVEGVEVRTYYHSLRDIRKALGTNFRMVRSESLGLFSAPPASTNFLRNYGGLQRMLRNLDFLVDTIPPFNRWGDHIIATFQYEGK